MKVVRNCWPRYEKIDLHVNHSLFSAFVIHPLESVIVKLATGIIQDSWLIVSEAEWAGFSMTFESKALKNKKLNFKFWYYQ